MKVDMEVLGRTSLIEHGVMTDVDTDAETTKKVFQRCGKLFPKSCSKLFPSPPGTCRVDKQTSRRYACSF